MKEIRLHGRGGQGSVTAAEMIAVAAFEDKRFSQAFPAFGVERRGAPVMAFARIADKPIRIRSQIYEPDYVIVQDVTLLDVVDVAAGLKPTGKIIINTDRPGEALNLKTDAEVITIASKKNPDLKISVPGERSMDAVTAERRTVECTGEVAPGLWVAGMAAAAVRQGPRMGPIFGGMLLSGRKVAEELIKSLDGC